MTNAWTYFRSTPLGELVTGTAHQAHPTDVTAPLGIRFAGQTILAVHVALEKAATVRVTFDREGTARLSGIRNVRQRSTSELSDVLRSEVAATGATAAVLVLATGWQVVLGQRAARPDAADAAGPFARYRLMAETPEAVVPRAQVDRVYTAIDHPVLDRSLVFSVRRRELEDLFQELRKCGLAVAAVRIPVAAQLETWLSSEGEGGLSRDLLVTDGLTALLVNTEQGDFAPPRGAVEADQPRQSVQRPGAIEEDLARFLEANGARAVTFLGPEELCAAAKKAAADVALVRPPDHPAHDTQLVALGARVRHDLNFEAREVRPALPRAWRRFVLGYGVLLGVLGVVAAINTAYAVRTGLLSYQLERDAARREAEASADEARMSRLVTDFADASRVRTWVASNYHAQRFSHALLRDVPTTAAIDKLLVELKDGQLTLTFVALGDQDTQLATHRAIERAIKDLRYKIAGEELPVATPGAARAVQYRLHLIVPDAAETTS